MADNSTRNKNLRGLMANGSTRNRIFLVGMVLLVMFIVAGYILSSPSKPSAQTGGSASVTPPPSVNAVPGTSKSKDYNKLVQQTDQRRLQQAEKQNTSSLPSLVGTSQQNLDEPIQTVTPPPASTAPDNASPVQTVQTVQTAQDTQPQQAVPGVNQMDSGNQADAESAADEQYQRYVQAFAFKAPSSEFSYYGQKLKQTTNGNGGASGQSNGNTSSSGTSGSTVASSGSGSSAGGPVFIRAGTVVPATLITPINSDTPGPVLAEITSGPFAGARLLGSFQATENQVVVKFNTLSMPGQPKSFKIQAFAVDENTSAPGLATSVNHHYLERYGLLAASAFISGYGQAVQNQGSTTVTGPFGATTQQSALSNKQIAEAAAGQVGQVMGTQFMQNAQTIKPTIRVQGKNGQGGVPIGVMFLSDF